MQKPCNNVRCNNNKKKIALLIEEKLFEIISQRYHLRRGYLIKSGIENFCEHDRINTILYTNEIYINNYNKYSMIKNIFIQNK